MTISIGSEVELRNIPKYLRVNNGDKGIVVNISNDPVQPYHVEIDGKIWTFSKREIKET